MDALKNSITELSEHFNAQMTEFQKSLQCSYIPASSPTSNIAAQFSAFRNFVFSALEGLQLQVDLLTKQQDQIEMKSRKKMLLVHGIPENKKENITVAVIKTLNDHLKIPDLTTDSLSRCHRIGPTKYDKPLGLLVLLKFRDLSLRNEIWFGKTGFKNSGITVSEFLTRDRHEAFVLARQHFGITKCWTKDGLIIVIGEDGTRHRVVSISDIYHLTKNKPHVNLAAASSATACNNPNITKEGGVWSLRNLSISVPRAVLSGEGQSAVLRCSYDLEGAALYSIRWYRAETEFYRYVPREMPPTMVFPLPGASVDLAQSDHQQVRIVNLNRRLSGDYQCEVSADAPLFHTDIRSAPLTVVDPPFRAPRLSVSHRSYARGDVIRANCSVDEAYPSPNISWTLDDHKIAETVSWRTSDLDFKERGAFSQLELTILEAEHYKVGLTYTSASLNRVYQDHYIYDRDLEDDTELIRYTMIPPPSSQFALGCVATIFDIYARKSEPVFIREDAPHPASVTGEDSSGTHASCNMILTVVIALLLTL